MAASRALSSNLRAELAETFRMDAGEVMFIDRALTHVRQQTYDPKYANLIARQIVPLDTEVDNAAETILYESYDRVGLARLLKSYADDLPRADVKKLENMAPVRGIGVSYAYSVQELRASSRVGRPLSASRAVAARRAFEELVDKIGAVGDSTFGLSGLLSQSAVAFATATTKTGGGTAWTGAGALSDEILADLNNMVTTIRNATNDVSSPDTIVLPVARHALIKTRARSATSDTTILSFFLANNPGVRVIPWARCNTAGAASGTRMCAFKADPMNLHLCIPQEFEQFPAQLEGLEAMVPCHGRIAGVIVPYPVEMLYMDAI